MLTKSLSIGTDVGGSHISCSAVDLRAGKILSHTLTREEVDNGAAADEVFRTWANAINETIAKIEVEKLAGLGFAIPGPFDYRNGISRMEHKYQNIYDKKISRELHPLLQLPEELPMRFLNDATSFAVGEAWLGKGSDFERVLAITLGTGFGSAFIDRGAPVIDRADVPEEGCLWHLPYREGLVDDYFTTRWFVKTYREKTGQEVSGAKEVADQARGSDPGAQGMFETYGKDMAGFLTPWLKKFEAGIIVIGGNISGAYDLFGPHLEDRLKKNGISVDIAISTLKENAAVIGSARLLDEWFWKRVSLQLPSI